MKKANKILTLVSYIMVAIGLFSIVTGFIAVLGYSDFIADYIGTQKIFNFINGGIYFMICGAIHIATASLAIYKAKKLKPKSLCIVVGIATLAWQLAAFIYLLTINYLSIRAALMVIAPAVYLTVAIICVVNDIISLSEVKQVSDHSQKGFATRKNFFAFNFSFKRKEFGGLHFTGKRHSSNVGNLFAFNGKKRRSVNIAKVIEFGKKRHKGRIDLSPKRRFKRR